jgi:hypothetical protein
MENNFWRDRIIQHDMMQKYLAGHTNYSKKTIFIGYFKKLFDQSRIFIWQTKSAPSQMKWQDLEVQVGIKGHHRIIIRHELLKTTSQLVDPACSIPY